MTELWVLVPSRGRPGSVARLARACSLTCQADTKLHFAFDEDDPALERNVAAAATHRYVVGPRQGLAAWTNDLAMRHVKRGDAGALASVGDDMLPVSDGWDRRLLDALPAGGGFSYPDDQRRADIPEAVVMSAHLVAALGWMAHPGMRHWFIDNVWRDLGYGAGCLVYCPEVLVQHLHPQVRPDVSRPDATYSDAAPHFSADMAVYQRWRLFGMRADVDAVRAARAAACIPPAA